MKIPKSIEKAIQLRAKYANNVIRYDVKISQFLRRNQIDDTSLNIAYGCMLITEPDAYAELTRKLIEQGSVD